jgi:membrane peptidoglycan carboxypeptidase
MKCSLHYKVEMKSKRAYPEKWRKYQAEFQKTAKRKRLLRKLPVLVTAAGGAIVILMLLLFTGSWLSGHNRPAIVPPPQPQVKLSARPEKVFRENLAVFLGEVAQDSSKLSDQFVLEREDGRYSITTTILPKLQEYIVSLLRRSKTLQSAAVVMNAYDGRIQAMASHNADGNGENLCLKAEFPAASLFKIVSAAAALETAGFTPEKEVTFQGSKHTLYKYQLKPSRERFTAKTNFSKAFASSNNSVFGKLGIYNLGQAVLTEYADKCLFNAPIPFDLPVAESIIEVPADEFGLAEIASGFNKRTLISPLHATLLAAMVANNGEIPAPWLIEIIRDDAEKVIYSGQQGVLRSSIRSKTAQDLKILMQEAVRNGTSRKAMWRLRQKKIFRNFEMGAKTGTINDKTDQFKYDWLTIYALAPDGINGISVGVLGVHDKVLGTRSTEMARAIIDFYFSSRRLD